jgi:hypothetical protein
MKKALPYFILLLSLISCVEKEEINLPKELLGKWEKDFIIENESWKHTYEFKSNGAFESISWRDQQTEEAQPGVLSFSKGNYAQKDGKLILSEIRLFYTDDLNNPPGKLNLLKEQLEWVVPDETAEYSLEEDNNGLVLTFLGCNDVLIPRARIANCAPPFPIAYTRVE